MLPEFAEQTSRFTLQERAGRGGMGDVFRAVDQETERTVAVKVLRWHADEADKKRFQREIAVIADLRHPNIVEYVAHGSLPDGRPFFAMEWLDGEDLRARERHTPLGMRDAVHIIRRSAAAMAAVHARGIVHRDLKLGNIFLLRGQGTAVKLIDFGVVKLPDDEPNDDRGTVIGTPHFMAPEQARGEIVDARADVYSLGAALFRLVTGRMVFETTHVIALLSRLVLEDPPIPMSVRFDVPESLSNVILQAISRKCEDRFENGGELARALARVGDLDNAPPGAERSDVRVAQAPTRVEPSVRREPSAAITAQTTAETIVVEPHTDLRPVQTPAPSKVARRVVAAVVFRLGRRPLDGPLEGELKETLGTDSRVEKLRGGETVALVGVRQSAGDEAIRAARAALFVTREVPSASAVIAVGHAVLVPNQARLGILATAAEGSSLGLGHAVLSGLSNLAGEALERAAEQLDAAGPGTVRADPSVLAFLGGRFVMNEDKLGAVLVREDQIGVGARLLLGKPTPTVGRDNEIAQLASVYAELLEEGTPRATLVTGPPGIGKSRVRAEVVQRLEASPYPPEILFTRGDSMSQRSSLSAFGRALRQVIGIHDGESHDAQVEKIRAHMSFRLPKPLRFLTSFFGEIVGVPFPDASDEPLRAARQNAPLMHSRTRMAVEAFVRAQSEIVPQVMILEDAHWADETTLDVIEWLLGCPDVKFSVFAFARPELEARIPAGWKNKTLTRLTLAPLAEEAAEKLVLEAMPSADEQLRTSIVERAGGNVLFLEELIRSAAQSNHSRGIASSGTSELPLTVQAVVQLRLDPLEPELRETVRAASVLGQVFWTGAVTALRFPGGGRDVARDLEALEESEIVTRHASSRVSGETEWSFRQALVRDAVYASMLEEDRAQWHLVAGGWLESRGHADQGLLAKHAEAGRDFGKAAQLYAFATRQAYNNGAHLETALELAERGLASGAQGGVRAQLLLAAAEARISLGKLEAGIHAGEEAAQNAPPGSDMWAESERLVAKALIDHGRSAEGDAKIVRALSYPFEHPLAPELHVSLLAVRVRGLVDLSQSQEALDVADEAARLARQLDSADAAKSLMEALEARLYALMQLGDPSEVVANGPRVIEMADAIGDLVNATRARFNTASSANLLGLWEQSRALLERALVDARSRRMRIHEAFVLQNLGMCEARLGLFDRAIAMESEAFKLGGEAHHVRLRFHARTYEAQFVLWKAKATNASPKSPDFALASELTKSLHELASSVPVILAWTPFFVSTELELALFAAGDASAADRALEAALEAQRLMPSSAVEEWEEAMHLSLVGAFLARGDESQADVALDRAFQSVREHAERITRPEHRSMYLARIPEIARIRALAQKRLKKTLSEVGDRPRWPAFDDPSTTTDQPDTRTLPPMLGLRPPPKAAAEPSKK